MSRVESTRWDNKLKEARAGLRAGLKRLAISVDKEQTDLLRGGELAGDYPIPVRTGNLLQGHYWALNPNPSALVGEVGNTAAYAIAVHDGGGNNSAHGERPFLSDAVAAVDAAKTVAGEVRRELT